VGKLRLLATIDEDRERELHRRFNHVHQRAEWFLASKSLLAYIAEIKKERI
jgi:hypothetical protein